MLRPMIVLLLAFVLTSPTRAQGILERARQDADRASPPDTSEPASSSKSKPCSAPDDDDSGLGFLAFGIVAAPFWLPPILLRDHFPEPGWFPGHPYALPDVGYLDRGTFRPGAADLDPFDPQRVKSWAVRAGAEAGDSFSGLTRIGARFAVETDTRFGATSSWDFFREHLPGGGSDQTVFGDLNLTFRFAQSGWMQMYTGLGARGMFDPDRTRAGVNFQYGADFFPADPVVVSTLFEMGNLREAFVTRLRATAGVQMQHAELFAGFDWLRVGGADLHGPMVGLRFWF